jgi:hypothetical protein
MFNGTLKVTFTVALAVGFAPISLRAGVVYTNLTGINRGAVM